MPNQSEPIFYNAINVGTLSPGVAFLDMKNNSPANGYGNDMGQQSDDIYYKFSLSVSAEVSISHCLSGFDTYMHLLDINGNILESNDDNGPLCSTLQSSIKRQLNAGTYYVVSEGYYTNSGNITTVISIPSGTGIMLADTLAYSKHIDGYLENLNKAYIPTGILYERAYPWASLFSFTGASTSDTSNYEHFLRAYEELHIASYSPQQIPHPDSIPNILKQSYQTNNYPIGVLLYDYNTIDTMAVQKSQFYVNNKKLYDVSGRSSSPYIANTAVVVSILGKFGRLGTNTFTLPSSYYFSNKGLTVNSLSVDFGNGSGYIALQPGGSASVNYSSSGDKNIKYILSLSNGQILYANSTYPIIEQPTIISPAGCTIDSLVKVTGRPFNVSQYVRSGGNEVTTINAYIYYSDANCSSKQITKPIIFLDGFDPANSRDHTEIYKDFINQEPLFLGDKLRNDGYDIIILDYKDGGDYMEKNALAVVSMLDTLYKIHSSTMTSDFVVIGPSMGGPIARYALAWAEKNGINLHSRLYIAFDGAIQGANIPIGLQQLISFAYKTQIGKTMEAQSPLNCNAAKQLLVHHYSSYQEVPTPHRYFSIFQQNLKNIGYPVNTRNVAIINGSKSVNQATTSASQEVMAMRIDARWPLGDIMRVKMFAGSASGRNRSLNLFLNNSIGKLIGAPPEETGYSQPYTSGYSYDVIPGGYSDTYKQIYDAAVGGLNEFYAAHADPFVRKQPSIKIGEIFGRDLSVVVPISKKRFHFSKTTDLHSFVPTTSGVDFVSSTSQRVLSYNWANEDIVCSGKTPFDAVYAPTVNEAHVQITSENAIWFENEIKGTPANGNGTNYSIIGLDSFCGASDYTLNIFPAGATINWTVTGTLSISGSSTGSSVTVNASGSGSGTLTASLISNCGNFSVTKTIFSSPLIENFRFTGPNPGNPYHMETLSAEVDPVSDALYYEWYTAGVLIETTYEPKVTTNNWQCGDYTLDVRAYTACGYTDYTGGLYWGMCRYTYSVSPNPASNDLTVEYKYDEGISEDKKIKKDFDIKLVNNKGIVLREQNNLTKENKITISVLNLPNDFYFLHIKDGKKVIKRQIIISH